MSIKETLKTLSKQLGVYHAVRYSKIYHRILKYKNPAYIQDLDADLAFYRNALGDSLGLVFDVGANHGDKTWAFRQIAKKVVCFEPDKTCFEANLPRFREETISIIDRFSHDRATRFNLRLEDDFVFSTHKISEDIISVLNRDEEVSYDVFVFCEKQV
jgi:hypothetical protein